MNSMLVIPVCFVIACAMVPAQERTRPNLVIILTDDQGYADIGVQGAQGFATPSIDRLSREGIRFTDFYVAQPVCSASRAALLTGCYPQRVGIAGALGPSARHGLADGETTLAEICRSAGYATAAFGKWHLGCQPPFLPTRHGFDRFEGIPYSNDMWPFHPESPKAWLDLPLLRGERVVAYNPHQRDFTSRFASLGSAFIEESVAAGRPFFLYVAHPMPHVPLHVSEARAGRSARGLYGDVIEDIDDSVGQILGTLERLGVDRDTLVVFSSDNGPWLSYGEHAGSALPLREGKGTTFEGGVRVPFVARWPAAIPAGSVCREPAMMIDILPTVARWLGQPLPDHPIDGLDIGDLLRAVPGAESPHEHLVFWYRSKGGPEAIRGGRWKLHLPHRYRSMEGRDPGPGGGLPGSYDYDRRIGLELFDLQSDPGETTDCAADHPEVVVRLQAAAGAAHERLEREAR
ncbi:MAG: sulfatase, partial [Planctomycetes bacterium]|nr:sulfatase [Planctomycetota bacterium]